MNVRSCSANKTVVDSSCISRRAAAPKKSVPSRRLTGPVVTHEPAPTRARSIIFRRHQLLLLCGYSVPRFTGRSHGRSLPTDFIAKKIAKIDAERGEVRLRHKPIAHLHLPARSTVFHCVDARAIVRAKAGNAVRFRAERLEGTLQVTAILPSGMTCPGPRPLRCRRIQLPRSEST